jgi:sister-chromatid-cohesion protein PDS5
VKAKKDMEAFAAANESRLYKLFKSCVDPESDLRTLVKAKVSQLPTDELYMLNLMYRMSSFDVSSNLTLTSSRPSLP